MACHRDPELTILASSNSLGDYFRRERCHDIACRSIQSIGVLLGAPLLYQTGSTCQRIIAVKQRPARLGRKQRGEKGFPKTLRAVGKQLEMPPVDISTDCPQLFARHELNLSPGQTFMPWSEKRDIGEPTIERECHDFVAREMSSLYSANGDSRDLSGLTMLMRDEHVALR